MRHTTPSATRDLLLIIGSGPAPMQQYLLERAAADYPLLLIEDQPLTWQRPYVVDHEVVADPTDPVALCAAADALAARWPLAGVLTWSENHVLSTARLAERLGLSGNPPRAALAARDKALGQQCFAAAGVPAAASTWVHSLDAAASAAERVGYPVVLKPASHTGSIGVTRVDTIGDLPRSWDIATAAVAHQGPEGQGALLQEYLDGPEVSVETVTYQGTTTAVALTRKTLGFAPHFLATAHSVTAEDPLLQTVAPLAAQALKALGITDGVSHVEMRFTVTGPRVIEVNARLAGDRIGDLVLRATGVDLPRAAAAIACGNAPDLQPTKRCSAAIGMLYPPADGVVTTRHLTPGSTDEEEFHWLCDIGDHVTRTPSTTTPNNTRAGFAIVTGPTVGQAQQRLADALARAEIEVQPAATPVA
ncbi:ATP-grasp domain-containing protein [Streptomyces noursei]|uniref:ATP-grasp domain-containing protein n=1 Tax=Streptomyces noursei TaxID=1971 RepID=UPI0016788597|nr:ATP-grasp domain-containing protein [Streptomyces noursei]MCZ1021378.1 ATP-grasp domain-containing protein [Streptomyces noursei]GGX54370.1 carboxylase [Streptomyces noursei]